MSLATESLRVWAREGIWVGVGLGTSVLAMLVGTRVLTTLLPTSEYGRLALAISAATLAVQMGATPISLTFLRYHSHWITDGKIPFLLKSTARYLAILLAIIGTVVGGLFLFSPGFVQSAGAGLTLLTGIFALLLVINRLAQALEDATRSRRIRGLLQGSLELGRFAFAIVIILLLSENNAEAAFIGFVLAGFLVVILHARYIRKIFPKPPAEQKELSDDGRRADRSALQSYLLPLIASNMCVWVVMMSERWVLQRYGDISDVGGYAAVYQLAFMPMALISNFLLVLTTPIIYQFIRVDSSSASTAQALRVNRYVGAAILAFSLFGSALLYLFHADVARVFLGPEFRTYSWMFPWLLLAGGSFAAAQQLLLKLTCDFDTLTLAKLWASLGALSIVSYIVGAQWGQLGGVVAAVVGVNGLLAILAMFLSLRNTTIEQ